jgi:hypothetical protein
MFEMNNESCSGNPRAEEAEAGSAREAEISEAEANRGSDVTDVSHLSQPIMPQPYLTHRREGIIICIQKASRNLPRIYSAFGFCAMML